MKDKEDKSLCGYGIFTLPEDHPFTPICRLSHDPAYQNYLDGFPGRPLSEADKAMYSAMLGVARANKSFKLKVQAHVFYGLTTVFRWAFR